MQSLLSAHMTGSRGSRSGMKSGEDVTAQRNGNNNQHEEFSVVLLHRVESDKFVIDNEETVLTDITVGGVEVVEVGTGKRAFGS
jgi:hypothetical protein